MKYGEAIEYLYGLQKYGMKFGLDNITRLLSAAGNPQKKFRVVHVAGTNGKGSTSAMIESMIRTSGATTGLFTSPHLVNFTERIRLNGEEIAEEDVIDLASEVRNISEKMEELSPTFFEVVACMAFLYFARHDVDWAVVEVGLGGRLDATNVLLPDVSVITAVGHDHCEFLGKTLKEIVGEKAGIIKARVPVVTAAQSPEAMEVLQRRAEEKDCRLFTYGNDFTAELLSDSLRGITFSYRGEREYEGVEVPLAGKHQMTNASLAVKTVEILSEKYGMTADIRKGLAEVKWPGRLEMANDDPPILIDGAHNPHAATELSRYLEQALSRGYRRIIMVAGIMADKDIDGILGPLLPLASEILFASPAYGRAASADMLASRAAAMGFLSQPAGSVSDALRMAEGLYAAGDLIVVTGSFYTIGEAKEALGAEGILTRLRE